MFFGRRTSIYLPRRGSRQRMGSGKGKKKIMVCTSVNIKLVTLSTVGPSLLDVFSVCLK